MGSSAAARLAGRKLANKPTMTLLTAATIITDGVTTGGGNVSGSGSVRSAPTMMSPSASPATPPRMVIASVSKTNCEMMVAGVAPSALRKPISRVRSCTDTSITFITPTAPIVSVSSPMV